jgi:hypothetical protein
MRSSLQHQTSSKYLSNALIIMVGVFFALFCLVIVLIEWMIELVAIPVVFFFTLAVLGYGLVRRKVISYPIISKPSAA